MRLLAVAAVIVVLVGAVVGLSGALDDGDGTTEVAAVLPATSLVGSGGSGADDDLTATTSDASGTAATEPGGFEIDSGPTAPVDPGGPVASTTPPGPGEPPATTPGATVPPATTAPTPTSTPPATTTTTTAPTTTAPTTTTRPRPVIVTFTAVTFGKQCRGGISWDLAWATADATEVLYGAEGATRQSGPSTGTASVCHPAAAAGTRFLLVATGPGGQTQQLITGSSGVR